MHFLATEQVKQGIQTEVWGIANGGRPASLHSEYEFTSFKINKVGLDRALQNAINSISDTSNNLFVLHGPFILDFLFVTRALKKKGIRFVFMPHDQYNEAFFQDNKLLKTLYFNLIEKAILTSASAIQVLHEDHADILEKLGINNDFIIIPQWNTRLRNVERLGSKKIRGVYIFLSWSS